MHSLNNEWSLSGKSAPFKAPQYRYCSLKVNPKIVLVSRISAWRVDGDDEQPPCAHHLNLQDAKSVYLSLLQWST